MIVCDYAKKIVSKIVKPTINQIAKYIPGESLINGKKDVIKLSSNESPFKIPRKVSAISKRLVSEFNLYPDGDSNILKKSLSKNFKINFLKLFVATALTIFYRLLLKPFRMEILKLSVANMVLFTTIVLKFLELKS